MIDEAELEQMRQRAAAAQPAAQAVVLRRGEGLYAGLPYDDPVELLEAAAASAADVLGLVAECERLAPASYVYGQEECAEGSCDHVDQLGAECPHLEERVARLGHVKQAEYLERLVESIRRRLTAGPDPAELVDEIDDALEVMRADEDIAVVAADHGVGAGEPGSPHDSGPDHGKGEVAR